MADWAQNTKILIYSPTNRYRARSGAARVQTGETTQNRKWHSSGVLKNRNRGWGERERRRERERTAEEEEEENCSRAWQETGTSQQEAFQIGMQTDRKRRWSSDREWICIVVVKKRIHEGNTFVCSEPGHHLLLRTGNHLALWQTIRLEMGVLCFSRACCCLADSTVQQFCSLLGWPLYM